jgi:hypothetical protein
MLSNPPEVTKVLRLPGCWGGAATGARLDIGMKPDRDSSILPIQAVSGLCNFDHWICGAVDILQH